MKKLVTFMLLIMIIISTGLSKLAMPIKDVDIDTLGVYESENMHYLIIFQKN